VNLANYKNKVTNIFQYLFARVIVQFLIVVREKDKIEKHWFKAPKTSSCITPFFVFMTSPVLNTQHTDSNPSLSFWHIKPSVITKMHCDFVPFDIVFYICWCRITFFERR